MLAILFIIVVLVMSINLILNGLYVRREREHDILDDHNNSMREIGKRIRLNLITLVILVVLAVITVLI